MIHLVHKDTESACLLKVTLQMVVGLPEATQLSGHTKAKVYRLLLLRAANCNKDQLNRNVAPLKSYVTVYRMTFATSSSCHN